MNHCNVSHDPYVHMDMNHNTNDDNSNEKTTV